MDSTHERLCHIYDAYRTALMNVKYYGGKLDSYKKIKSTISYAIVFAFLVVIIASFIFGFKVFSVLMFSILLLPILGEIDERCGRYQEMWESYNDIAMQFQQIVSDIKTKQGLSEEIGKRAAYLDGRMHEISLADDCKPDLKKLSQYQEEVNRQVPADSLWIPSQ